MPEAQRIEGDMNWRRRRGADQGGDRPFSSIELSRTAEEDCGMRNGRRELREEFFGIWERMVVAKEMTGRRTTKRESFFAKRYNIPRVQASSSSSAAAAPLRAGCLLNNWP